MEELKEQREDCPYPVILDGSKVRVPLCMGGEEHRDCLVCAEPINTEVLVNTVKKMDEDNFNRGYN
jgi:hypothetical protein